MDASVQGSLRDLTLDDPAEEIRFLEERLH
jgi:hypothetical protein